MGKISLKPNNDFCPQTLFLYGTYDEKGNPDFGLFLLVQLYLGWRIGSNVLHRWK